MDPNSKIYKMEDVRKQLSLRAQRDRQALKQAGMYDVYLSTRVKD